MQLAIPGQEKALVINSLILDLNGTLAIDGKIIEGVAERIEALREKALKLFLFTGDTHGNAGKIAEELGLEVRVTKGADEKAAEAMKNSEPMASVVVMPMMAARDPATSGMAPCENAERDPFIPSTLPWLSGETCFERIAVRFAIEMPCGIAMSGITAYSRYACGTAAKPSTEMPTSGMVNLSSCRSTKRVEMMRSMKPCVMTTHTPSNTLTFHR
jgi:hypothetical protein